MGLTVPLRGRIINADYIPKGVLTPMALNILLSSGTSGAENYEQALKALGATPTSRYCPAADSSYDGLLLCGGSDVAPDRFGQENQGSVGIDLARDEAEFALVKAYLAARKPIFGICRGHQVINIALGGTLIQDLPAVGHTLHTPEPPEKRDKVHSVRAAEGSFFETAYGARFSVNSAHHQGLGELGTGLIPTLWAEDGTIEAMEHNALPILCVQFHPERMSLSHRRTDTIDGLPLFQRFLSLCQP